MGAIFFVNVIRVSLTKKVAFEQNLTGVRHWLKGYPREEHPGQSSRISGVKVLRKDPHWFVKVRKPEQLERSKGEDWKTGYD